MNKMSTKAGKHDASSTDRRVSKSRNSFRFGRNKRSHNSRNAHNTSGKKVEIKGQSVIEELERKMNEIFRLIEFSEDAVEKNIPAYLVGFPPLILENVIALTRDLEHIADSSELRILLKRMNEAVADHALWIDRFYMYGDGSHSELAFDVAVDNLRLAVREIVAFGIKKEKDESSFFRSKRDDSADSPYARKKYDSRRRETHGSMPEIPAAVSGYKTPNYCRSRGQSPSPSRKITHSFSSDSILDNTKDNLSSTPNSSLVGDYASSQDGERAPPIPPKKSHRLRIHRSSCNDLEHPINICYDEIANRHSAGSLYSQGSYNMSPHNLTPSNSTRNDSIELNSSMSHSSNASQNSISLNNEKTGGSQNSFSSLDLSPISSALAYTARNNCDSNELYAKAPRTCHATENQNRNQQLQQHELTKHRIIFDQKRRDQQALPYTSSTLDQITRLSACSSSSRSSESELDQSASNVLTMSVPPPIPKKTRSNNTPQYDTIDFSATPSNVQLRHHPDNYLLKAHSNTSYSASNSSGLGSSKSSMSSFEGSTVHSNQSSNVTTLTHVSRFSESMKLSHTRSIDSDKPPLPIKQKHIMEYMQTFKNYQMPEKEWFQHRRSQQVFSSYRLPIVNPENQSRDNSFEIDHANPSYGLRSSLPAPLHIPVPPALPPKRKSRSPVHNIKQKLQPDNCLGGKSNSAYNTHLSPDLKVQNSDKEQEESFPIANKNFSGLYCDNNGVLRHHNTPYSQPPDVPRNWENSTRYNRGENSHRREKSWDSSGYSRQSLLGHHYSQSFRDNDQTRLQDDRKPRDIFHEIDRTKYYKTENERSGIPNSASLVNAINKLETKSDYLIDKNSKVACTSPIIRSPTHRIYHDTNLLFKDDHFGQTSKHNTGIFNPNISNKTHPMDSHFTHKSNSSEINSQPIADHFDSYLDQEHRGQDLIHKIEHEKREENLMERLNVDELITFQDTQTDADVKYASADALIVYATSTKNGTYLEAFLTTYRTFITPQELIAKLLYRYHKFVEQPSLEHQKGAKNAFSLLIRVVHDLVVTELSEQLLKTLSQFEYDLLSKGELKLALYFRKKLSEKLKLRKTNMEVFNDSYKYLPVSNRNYTLLDFKANEIAEQMTLLDAELFNKLGIPEILHYSREQNEENCPNLAAFAMQINRMSAWVKTQILTSNFQDRERYYKKFGKVMKHLRKAYNNYNSCIAILSGLESADVRRLDWPKSSTDMLKEYCDLFDFEGSYRAYRQALAETKPPCIPHLGIILQDLTKLHNINPNLVEGQINFLKRWLQFNIVEDMRRFIPSKYEIRKNESIRRFINNYEDCMSDSDLWDLSLSIKPKPKPK